MDISQKLKAAILFTGLGLTAVVGCSDTPGVVDKYEQTYTGKTTIRVLQDVRSWNQDKYRVEVTDSLGNLLFQVGVLNIDYGWTPEGKWEDNELQRTRYAK